VIEDDEKYGGNRKNERRVAVGRSIAAITDRVAQEALSTASNLCIQ
jgi:hypothetical protein